MHPPVTMSIRRLNKEYGAAPRDGHIRLVELVDDDITKQRWEIIPDAELKGAVISVLVDAPTNYPFQAPKVMLDKPIFHPNVHERQLCLETINQWNPKTTIHQIMEEVHKLLLSPNIDSALCPEAAELFKQDRPEYIRRAFQSMV